MSSKPRRFKSAEDFEAWYAANGNLTVERWREIAGEDRYPAPCDCGDKLCTGWQMAHRCDSPSYHPRLERTTDTGNGK